MNYHSFLPDSEYYPFFGNDSDLGLIFRQITIAEMFGLCDYKNYFFHPDSKFTSINGRLAVWEFADDSSCALFFRRYTPENQIYYLLIPSWKIIFNSDGSLREVEYTQLSWGGHII